MSVVKKIFGQIEMKWWKVIAFAVVMGVYTGVIALLVSPSSWYHDIAETVERWILPAVFVIVNCKKPLEAALKTFVFFLISQPLVYLVQVPFAEMGWELFKYYKYWFIVTLLTFPGAFIGWFIKKDNILSGLILSVVLVIIAGKGVMYVRDCMRGEVSQNLGGAIYCFLVALLLIFVILSDFKARLTAALITLAFTAGFFAFKVAKNDPALAVNGYLDVGKYGITLDWTASSSDPGVIDAVVGESLSGEPDVKISVYKNGEAVLTLTAPDGKTVSFDASYDKEREPDFKLVEKQ